MHQAFEPNEREAAVLRGDPGCTYKYLEARVAPSVDPTAAVDVACYMTTDTVDADDEVVLPSGVDLSRFEKNPVLMLCHGYGQPGCYYPLPIGKVVWTKRRPHGVMAGVKFAQSTALGREVKALFDEDMVRAFSIGFLSLESSPMTRDEAASRPGWQAAFDRTGGRVLVHRRWTLLELSVAPVPSNEDALRASYQAKGLPIPEWIALASPREANRSDPAPVEPVPAEEPGAAAIAELDYVAIDAPGYKGVGLVESLHHDGLVPDAFNDVLGTADEPAARVRCYKALGTGFVATEYRIGVACRDLTRIAPLAAPSSTPLARTAAPGPPSLQDGEGPLPPLVSLTEAELVDQALARLDSLLRPEAIRAMVADELDRRLGCV
jgi:hypothetical protein